MIFVKINNTLYPAKVFGKIADADWDNRATKSITLEMGVEEASRTFVHGLLWSIVEKTEFPVYDNDGAFLQNEIKQTEYNNNDFCLAGDLTDHRDGTITIKMGKLTELEEAYKIMFGGNS